eukprot:scaffold160879_cov21-Tisochrysis_lutea.AAC.1
MQSAQPPLTDRPATTLSAPHFNALPQPFLTPRPVASVYTEPGDETGREQQVSLILADSGARGPPYKKA